MIVMMMVMMMVVFLEFSRKPKALKMHRKRERERNDPKSGWPKVGHSERAV
jgi:hypothetical protein